jgi:hypothetical protein
MAAAYGGRERLEKIVAMRQTGHVNAAVRVSSSGPVARTYARPLKLRVEVGDPAKPTEVRVLDGEKGWRNGQPVTGMSYDAMVLQAVRLDLPFQLLTHQNKLVEKEPLDREGKKLRVVELPLENGLSVTAAIDPETGRILSSTGNTAAGAMGRMSFETTYDDFAKVEGVLFGFKEVNVAGGTKTADTVLTVIQLLKSAPADAFKP